MTSKIARPGELGGAVPDPMHLDVIGMAVHPVPVVHDEDVDGLFPKHLGDAGRGDLRVGLPEALRVLVLLPPGHARVAISEPDDSVRTEHLSRTFGLRPAPVDQRLAIGQVVGGLTVLAIRCHDQENSMALGRSAGDRPARGDHLIVGVGVEERNASGASFVHAVSLA